MALSLCHQPQPLLNNEGHLTSEPHLTLVKRELKCTYPTYFFEWLLSGLRASIDDLYELSVKS